MEAAASNQSEGLAGQLDLIEQLILDGRHDTEVWGWSFVLWGVGHVTAAVWSYLAQSGLPWAIVMSTCGLAMGAVSIARKRKRQKVTAISRSLGSIWAAFGISLGVVIVCGRGADVAFFTQFFVLMGAANYASGMILRWRAQTLVGLAWFAAAVGSTFLPPIPRYWLFVAMAVLCEILFGAYLMVLERREMKTGA